jgi:hypothetical protein
MKRAGHLFEKVCAFANLRSAALVAMRGKGHKPHIARFFLNLEPELLCLQTELLSDDYRPGPYRCFEIFEPKRRHICAATFRDRVVHHALCNHLGPVLERGFISDSYACRVGKGTHAAVRRARSFSRRFSFFVKADVEKFFASMDHAVLKTLLRRKIKDRRLLNLMNRIIDHPVPGHPPGKGLAIGNLTSQWWANLYLDPLDHFFKDESGAKGYVRYMDDFLLFGDEKAELHRIRAEAESFLWNRLRLRLKPGATFLAPAGQGIPFLGYRVFPGTVRIQRRGLIRFRRNLWQKERSWAAGEIDETTFLRSVAALVGHLRHGNTHRLRQTLLENRQ